MHIIVKELKKKPLNSNSIAKALKNGSKMRDLAPWILVSSVTIELLRTDIPSELRVTE